VFKGKLEQFTNPLIQPFIGALDRRLEEMRKATPTTSTTPPTPATPSVLTPKPTPRRPRRERKSLVEEIREAMQPVDWHYVIPPPSGMEDEWRDWLESEIKNIRNVPLCLKASLIYPYFPWFTFTDTGRKVPQVYIEDAFSFECNITGYRDSRFTENYCAIMAPEYYNPKMLRSSAT
jgi:hypothetical protein